MSLINDIKNEFKRTLQLFAGVTASEDTSTAEPSASGDTKYKPVSKDDVSLSDKVVGSKAEQINSDKSLSVLPDGNYELVPDGFCFTVTDGLISAIQGQEEPIDEDMAADAAPAPNPEIEALKADIATLQSQVAELLSSMSGMSENFASKVETATKDDVKNFEAVVKELNSNMMKLAKLPAEPSKTNTKVEVKNADDEKLKQLANSFSNIKNK